MFNTENQPQDHQMELVRTYPSGAEEWHCPTCGRRFLIQWPPNYEKVILEAGDEYAFHSGVKGGELGLRLQAPSAPQGSPEEEPLLSEELRAALEEVLEDIDFDDWPDATAGQ